MSINVIFKRGIYVLKKEGVWTFLKRVLSFLGGFFYSWGTYYIYEKALTKDEKYFFKPKMQNIEIKIISTTEEFEQLIFNGYNFKEMLFKDKLKKGAVAFCIFLDKELIQVTWVALNERAKKELNSLPYKVEFNKKEVYSGTVFTESCYKGKNLLGYTYSHIFPYLAQKGIVKDKFTIEVNNISSQKAHAKFNPTIIGKGHYLKILWWEFWKEEPLKELKR